MEKRNSVFIATIQGFLKEDLKVNMKRLKHFLIILTIVGFVSCQKPDIEKDTPSCIEDLIADFDKEQSCDNGVSVRKYSFQNETVFVFDPGTCGDDLTSEVFDSDCNSLGYLGGISGNTEINGEDFSTATFESIVWEK